MTQEAFKAWWYNEGSQAPYTHHDCEEHTMRMCEIAWANGAYKALAEHAMREVQRLGQEIEQEPVAKYCCRLCFNKSGSLLLDRMILCSECGNKRCPKATNHELQCTNSNEPNQAGSIYNTPPQRTEPICPDCKAEVLYECVACSCNNYPPKETT